jgi:hypothetical protein
MRLSDNLLAQAPDNSAEREPDAPFHDHFSDVSNRDSAHRNDFFDLSVDVSGLGSVTKDLQAESLLLLGKEARRYSDLLGKVSDVYSLGGVGVRSVEVVDLIVSGNETGAQEASENLVDEVASFLIDLESKTTGLHLFVIERMLHLQLQGDSSFNNLFDDRKSEIY